MSEQKNENLDLTKHKSFDEIKKAIGNFPDTDSLLKFRTSEEGMDASDKLHFWVESASSALISAQSIVSIHLNGSWSDNLEVKPLLAFMDSICTLGRLLAKANNASARISGRLGMVIQEEKKNKNR